MKRRQAKRERAGLASVAAALRKEQAATAASRQQGDALKADLRRQAYELMAAIDRHRDLHARLTEAESFARDVARLVGNESIANRVPVKFNYTVPDGRADFLIGIRERILTYTKPVFDTVPMSQMRTETMRLLRVDVVRAGIEEMRHIRIRLKGQEYGYAINDRAIAGMPADMLARNLGEKIARELVAALKTK